MLRKFSEVSQVYAKFSESRNTDHDEAQNFNILIYFFRNSNISYLQFFF